MATYTGSPIATSGIGLSRSTAGNYLALSANQYAIFQVGGANAVTKLYVNGTFLLGATDGSTGWYLGPSQTLDYVGLAGGDVVITGVIFTNPSP